MPLHLSPPVVPAFIEGGCRNGGLLRIVNGKDAGDSHGMLSEAGRADPLPCGYYGRLCHRSLHGRRAALFSSNRCRGTGLLHSN